MKGGNESLPDTCLDRAIADGHAKLVGDGKAERIHYLAIGAEAGPLEKLIETYRALGYYISVTGVTADLEQSLRWNQERSNDNISAYYTESFHHRWLLAAAAAANSRTSWTA